uniref:STAS domain-containing protein n=1 Tax=Clastoptera arizonana TaxID=38151 RepID=A0A1B6C1R2_9HEMI
MFFLLCRLPEPRLPPFSLMPAIALDSFVIAVVAYVISISMALIFAQKLNYEISPNQELLAQGAGNLVGSCFLCLPFAASLSRSVIQQTVGGRTQLTSVISAIILIGVLTSFAQIFETLPRCILASLIIVALKGVLLQAKDVFRIWKLSPLDGIVWVTTYLTVILVEIDIGLLVGVLVSNLVLCIRGIKPNIYRLCHLANTEMYVDPHRFSKVEEITGVCIIHYAGSLNFANQRYFKQQVYKIMDRDPKKELIESNIKTSKVSPTDLCLKPAEFLVLDLSGVLFTDPSGAFALLSIAQEYSQISVHTLLAGTTGPVHDSLRKYGLFDKQLLTCFPTIHDAVIYAENNRLQLIQQTRL